VSNEIYALSQNKGISNLEELRSFEVVRTENMTAALRPKVIINYEYISFNKACVNLFPNTQYVNILIDRVKFRIIVLPAHQYAKDALRWCNVRDGEVRRRDCTAKKFGEKMYDMMQWIKENRYRVIAYYQEVDGVKLLVFNLRECEMVVPEYVTLPNGKTVKRGRVILPEDWTGFGMAHEDHKKANDVELDAHYSLTERDREVTISEVQVTGAIPTEKEVVQSHYKEEPREDVFANA